MGTFCVIGLISNIMMALELRKLTDSTIPSHSGQPQWGIQSIPPVRCTKFLLVTLCFLFCFHFTEISNKICLLKIANFWFFAITILKIQISMGIVYSHWTTWNKLHLDELTISYLLIYHDIFIKAIFSPFWPPACAKPPKWIFCKATHIMIRPLTMAPK